MAAACRNPHASLVTGHAYAMLGTVRLSNGVQLVQLRNPWGREQYSGPYSDDSRDWTSSLRREAGQVSADDGKFFIPLDDFKIAFTDYSILAYQDWNRSAKTETNSGKQFEYSMTADADEEIILTFEHMNTRHIPRGCPTDDVNYNLYLSDDPRTPLAVSTTTSYWSKKV